MKSAAGLVLQARGERRFLPALFVENVVPMPRLSAVPGSSQKLALVRGRVISVVELGPPSSHLVVCLRDGEPVGLSGARVERTGFFPELGDGVELDGEAIAPFDLKRELESRTPEAK